MNNVLILDAGNSIIKSRTAGREDAFVHALYQMTDAEWDKILLHSRGVPPEGYIRINGQPYAYGEMAERRAVNARKSGAGRYTKEYYGALVAIALSRVYRQSGDVLLFGSHAPRDVAYADHLIGAAKGSYHVESQGAEMVFRVLGGATFDEPVGGLMNLVLNEEGRGYAHAEINEGDTLVIDIGGVTTDFLSVAGGIVDYNIAESVPVGIRQVERDFARSLRSAYSEQLKDTSDLPGDRIRSAIQTGQASIAGRHYPCGDLVVEATNILLNRIYEIYQNVAGGAGRWDQVVLTGGGSGMLYHRLRGLLNHGRVFIADPRPQPDLNEIHLANVRGGLKLWRYYVAEGIY